MKTKLLTIAMTAALMLTAMTKVQAQNFEGPCLPYAHGLNGHQSAFCGSTETQTVQLIAGTNWFSTYLDITLDDLKAALREALPGAANRSIVIKSQNDGQCQNIAATWGGSLRALDVKQMYKITVPADCEITLEGMPIDPAELTFTIVNGINWIGFPLQEEMTVTNAFAGFPAKNDIVKSQSNGQAKWNNTIWTGALKKLVPGKGYVYNSVATENKPFVYPSAK